MMSGSGPDVLLINKYTNTNKMIRAGAFADMSPFIEADTEFDWSKYNQAVIDGGKWNGGQYVMPIQYELPLVLSTQEILDETGFDLSTANNYADFVEECADYQQNRTNEMPLRSCLTPQVMFPYVQGIKPDLINYDTREINLNNPEFQQIIEQNKLGITKQYYIDGLGDDASYAADSVARNLSNSSAVFHYNTFAAPARFFFAYRALKKQGYTPIYEPLCNANGEFTVRIILSAVINANSPNKQNAYNFIKALISPEAYNAQPLSPYYPHVYTQGMQEYMQSLVGKDEVVPNPVLEVAGLTQDEVNRFMEIINEIDSAYIEDYDVRTAFEKEMTPFLSGEKSYQSCINRAQNKIKILVSE